MRIKRKALRGDAVYRQSEAFQHLSKAHETGRKAIRRVVLNKR